MTKEKTPYVVFNCPHTDYRKACYFITVFVMATSRTEAIKIAATKYSWAKKSFKKPVAVPFEDGGEILL